MNLPLFFFVISIELCLLQQIAQVIYLSFTLLCEVGHLIYLNDPSNPILSSYGEWLVSDKTDVLISNNFVAEMNRPLNYPPIRYTRSRWQRLVLFVYEYCCTYWLLPWIRPVYKRLVHLVTGKCEIERICYYNARHNRPLLLGRWARHYFGAHLTLPFSALAQ